MGIFSALKEALCGPPPGPVYDVDDIRFNLEEYERHVNSAHDILMKHLPKDSAYNHLTKKRSKDEDPIVLVGLAKWRSLENVREQVNDFISDFSKYTDGRPAQRSTANVCRQTVVYGDKPHDALRHISALKEHEDAIFDAINFFLCDRRSNFDGKAADEAEFGQSGSLQRANWRFVCKRSLRASMDKIRASFTKVAEMEIG